MKTYLPGQAELDNKKWYLVDAEGKTLGRLASRIAAILRGKHKPSYTPSVDTGDFIVVVNAEKIRVTGKKLTDKLYRRHSGYPGGFKATALGVLLKEKPEEVLKTAVEGMLPAGSLGGKMLKKLKVYSGKGHPHKAQNPETLGNIA
ncbi:MAG: 50S ribosomal protein L13 [Deltaproteobacteria bacterium]|nr:50S ribosomal protein L13 [Deltaproteobacteria bacterium]